METKIKTGINKYHRVCAWYLLPSPYVQVDKVGRIRAVRVGISWLRWSADIQLVRGPFDELRIALRGLLDSVHRRTNGKHRD